MGVKAHNKVKVHIVLVDPSEEIFQKAVQALGIATSNQWGPCEARLQVKAKQKWKVARPNGKLEVEASMIYKRKMKDCEVGKYRCRLPQVEGMHYSPTPATA